MRSLPILFLALAGCATTPAALGRDEVSRTIASTKSAAVVARCAADNFPASMTSIRDLGEGRWYVILGDRHRWDFTPTATGSVAELRSSGVMGSRSTTVERCATGQL